MEVQYTAIFFSFILIVFIWSPLNAVIIYFIVRPIIQPFAHLQYKLFDLPIGVLTSILLIFIALINVCFRKNQYILVAPVTLLYLMIIPIFISLFYTGSYLLSLDAITKYFFGLAVFLLVYNSLNSRSQCVYFLKGIAVSSILPIAVGFYQVFTGKYDLIHSAGIERANSIFGIGNAFGVYMSIVMCGLLMLLLFENKKSVRYFTVILLALLSVLQVLALNRGTWIALFMGVCISAFFYRKMIKIRWFLVSGVLIALFFGGIIIDRFQNIERVNEYGQTVNTFQERINYWQMIYPLIIQKPIAGHGIGTTELVTEQYFKRNSPPHNDYVRLALDIGILGVFFYVLFLLFEFFRNIKKAFEGHNWEVNFPTLILVVYFIVISTTQNIVYNLINFPLFLSIIAVSIKYNEVNL